MRTLLNRALLGTALLIIGLPAQAAMWVLDPGMSQVVFKYSYGTDPYEGRFTNVQATFDFDPMRPGSCNFDVVINIESTVNAIRKALQEAELMAGCEIKSVCAGIAGGLFVVEALSDGEFIGTGPMSKGRVFRMGPCARLRMR